MNIYERTLLDRAYQSYVTGGDSYAFSFPTGKMAFERPLYIEAAEKLEAEGMLVVVSQSEKRIRIRLTDNGIDYGNKQGL